MSQLPFKLTTDEVDDLIYFSRVGDLESLKESIENLVKVHSCSASSILISAIDVDEEGLGSGSCILHYPAANGNLEIVNYLISLVSPASSSPPTSSETGLVPNGEGAQPLKFVNHQNVSGNTPLHWAGMNGHLQIVQALVKAGADPEIVNGAGRDAVVESEWSAKEGASECAVWILGECGALEKGVGIDGADVDGEGYDVGDGEDDDAVDEKRGDVNGETSKQSAT